MQFVKVEAWHFIVQQEQISSQFLFILFLEVQVTMPAIFKKHHAYSKLDIEDPEDRSHRRAQFLIYKTLQEADEHHHNHSNTKKSSYNGIKFCNLRVELGKKVKKLKSCLCFNVSLAKIGMYRQVVVQLKTWRKFLAGKERFRSAAATATLPRPLLTV